MNSDDEYQATLRDAEFGLRLASILIAISFAALIAALVFASTGAFSEPPPQKVLAPADHRHHP